MNSKCGFQSIIVYSVQGLHCLLFLSIGIALMDEGHSSPSLSQQILISQYLSLVSAENEMMNQRTLALWPWYHILVID